MSFNVPVSERVRNVKAVHRAKRKSEDISAPSKKCLLLANTQNLVFIWEFSLERKLMNILNLKKLKGFLTQHQKIQARIKLYEDNSCMYRTDITQDDIAHKVESLYKSNEYWQAFNCHSPLMECQDTYAKHKASNYT